MVEYFHVGVTPTTDLTYSKGRETNVGKDIHLFLLYALQILK